jgi:tetratricopeptide (TPR) repeat protein
LSEPLAFALAALAFVAAHDTATFTVEDDTVFYEFDVDAAPQLMERLDSPVLREPESTRIEAVRTAAEATMQALADERPEDAAIAARTARIWTWGLRERAEIARAYRASATSFLEQGELDRAVTDASFSLHLEPDADAYDTRAIAEHIAGDVEEALDDYTRSLGLAPDDPRVLSNRAEAHYDIGNDEACIADAGRAMALDPEDPDPVLHCGKALIRLGRIAEARTFAERAAALGDESLLDEIGHYEG